MFSRRWRIAVDLEPSERLREDGAFHQRVLGARTGFDVVQTPLHREQMPKVLDIASRERQATQSRRGRVMAEQVFAAAMHGARPSRCQAEGQ